MKNKTILFVIILSVLYNTSIFAQEDTLDVENPISVTCDVMSRYVWRGTDFGTSPSIQPGLEYSIKGLTLGAWGAYSTNLTGIQEADLYLSYTFKEIVSLTVTDYYFPDEFMGYKYYDFDNKTTGHVLETMLSFNGTEKLPLSLLVAANVWGGDAKKINNDGTIGEIQYSTYAELKYSFKHFDLFIGANLTDPNEGKGESGYYGDSIGIVNFGLSTTKNIKVTDKYELPLSISLISNPQAERIYLVAGFSF